jgi:hypothetical protein
MRLSPGIIPLSRSLSAYPRCRRDRKKLLHTMRQDQRSWRKSRVRIPPENTLNRVFRQTPSHGWNRSLDQESSLRSTPPGIRFRLRRTSARLIKLSIIPSCQAILTLVNVGLLIRKQGKGMFVKKGLKKFKNTKALRLSGNAGDVMPDGLSAQDARVPSTVKVNSHQGVAKLSSLEDDKEIILATFYQPDQFRYIVALRFRSR